MFEAKKTRNEFAEECTACGLCVECCPIVSQTELKDFFPEKIMGEVVDLFRRKTVGDLARTRIYSCLYCNTCTPVCPQKLHPAHAFAVGKAILQETGDPIPKGVSAIFHFAAALIAKAIPAFLEDPSLAETMITDVSNRPSRPPRTVLFPSCFGLVQSGALKTTIEILRRIDPTVKVLAGVDYCCGELQLMSGQPEAAERQFARMVEALNSLAPERVVIFCPTCNMNFDGHNPKTRWSWHFITDFVAENLDRLGPLRRVQVPVNTGLRFSMKALRPSS